MLAISKVILGKEPVESTAQRQKVGERASFAGIGFYTVLCAAKAAIGMAAGSVSIVADAVNNLADAASNIICLFGFKLAGKPADAAHPYGHGPQHPLRFRAGSAVRRRGQNGHSGKVL